MPQAKVHPTPAARQAAYRARMNQHMTTLNVLTDLPDWDPFRPQQPIARWQLLATIANQTLAMLNSEMSDYMGKRSEAWSETEAASEFEDRMSAVEEARDRLSDAFPTTQTIAANRHIKGLSILTKNA